MHAVPHNMEEIQNGKYRKLGRTSSQRKAIFRNQVTNLLYHGKIRTTETRAKEIRKDR
jgi:large subunit ribosomal protein L17